MSFYNFTTTVSSITLIDTTAGYVPLNIYEKPKDKNTPIYIFVTAENKSHSLTYKDELGFMHGEHQFAGNLCQARFQDSRKFQ